ncbi:hypothetical protein DB346_02040 [Verrucomicrobia bacterium LW23]|nr:hypothetical protein DB346_02040 [Verrucomicrobia bacterium LW23]
MFKSRKAPFPTKAEQAKADKAVVDAIASGRHDPALPVEACRLDFTGFRLSASQLPRDITCRELLLAKLPIDEVLPGWRASSLLSLEGCASLIRLPQGLSTATLNISQCVALKQLPQAMSVNYLNASQCTALEEWPESAQVRSGGVDLTGCVRVTRLPAIGNVSFLNLAGCERLTELADGTTVSSWLDISRSGIRVLPPSLEGAPLRWGGVLVTEQIVFRPETLEVDKVLQDRNIERRRVCVERMGPARFLSHPGIRVLDTDSDRGGTRRLLQIPLRGDEPLAVVDVRCPSTGRQYLVRVPPAMRTCRQAMAWTAGFDNPDEVEFVEET